MTFHTLHCHDALALLTFLAKGFAFADPALRLNVTPAPPAAALPTLLGEPFCCWGIFLQGEVGGGGGGGGL
jgi:hypothetical protein